MPANRMKLLRRELGLTQAEFGARLGTSKDVIGNLEYGRVQPRPVFLKHVCSVYNVNPAWLLEGRGEMFAEGGKNLSEVMELFRTLDDRHQDYVLRAIRGLVELLQDRPPD